MRKIGKSIVTLSMATILTLSDAAVLGDTFVVQAAAKQTKEQKIVLATKKHTMAIGDKYTFTAKIKNVKTVVWKSSNQKIAAVNKKGVVTAKKAGTVTITATAKENKNVKASCKIKVQNKEKINGVNQEQQAMQGEPLKSNTMLQEIKGNAQYTTELPSVQQGMDKEEIVSEVTPKEESFSSEDKVVAKVTGENLTINDGVEIEVELISEGNPTYYYAEEPGTLEKYENGEWVALEKNPNQCYIDIAYEISIGQTAKMAVTPALSYVNVTAGHYRYMYTLMGRAEGLPVVVEFDLAEAENVETIIQAEEEEPQYSEVIIQQDKVLADEKETDIGQVQTVNAPLEELDIQQEKGNAEQMIEPAMQKVNLQSVENILSQKVERKEATEATKAAGDMVVSGEDVVVAEVVKDSLITKNSETAKTASVKEKKTNKNTCLETLGEIGNNEQTKLVKQGSEYDVDTVEETLAGQKKKKNVCLAVILLSMMIGCYHDLKKRTKKQNLTVVTDLVNMPYPIKSEVLQD